MTSENPLLKTELCKLSDAMVRQMEEIVRRVLAEQNQARPAPVGALTPAQAAKYLGVGKTRFYELLKEHPELDAMGFAYTKRKDGKKYRKWLREDLDAWLKRQGQSDLAGSLDEAA
jgi:excisionase family DNA binding protein